MECLFDSCWFQGTYAREVLSETKISDLILRSSREIHEVLYYLSLTKRGLHMLLYSFAKILWTCCYLYIMIIIIFLLGT